MITTALYIIITTALLITGRKYIKWSEPKRVKYTRTHKIANYRATYWTGKGYGKHWISRKPIRINKNGQFQELIYRI